MFQELTSFLEKLDSEEPGTWVIDKENDGNKEHPIQMPYINYGKTATEFEDAVYMFERSHPEYKMSRYGNTLEEKGIEWGNRPMEEVPVDDLDAMTILALLMGAIRAEHFCDGAILGFLKRGTIQKWLRRLAELDT